MEDLEIKGFGKFEILADKDKDFPGVDVEWSFDQETNSVSKPRVRMEWAYGKLRVLVWADKDSEDYTDCITIKL